MSLINSTAIPSGASAYEIEQSLRFNQADSSYLSRTVTSASNRKTWTFSAWCKKSSLANVSPRAANTLFDAYVNNDNRLRFYFDDTGPLSLYGRVGGSNTMRMLTTATYRDFSAWYHVVLAVDTTQGTNTNRLKLYVNGEQITSFSSLTYPSQNAESPVNSAISHKIGVGSYSSGSAGTYLDGYLGEVNFIDGQQLTPADFGETGDNGEWKPKQYSGSYSTNGFYQKYASGGHTSFLTSGTYTAPVGVTTVNYLVIGGGGGGGSRFGGGGGAGGYRTGTLSVTAGNSYSVTVGAGGAGGVISGGSGTGGAGQGTNGSSSVFSSITSTGGGGGGYGDAGDGSDGASGGAGAGRFAADGGDSTSYGNDGGDGSGNSLGGDNFRAGGGGGSSAAGSTGGPDSGDNGNGGAGTASSITGTSVTRAGGGGGGGGASTSHSGGAGGSGGAGAGGFGIAGTNATANTGSGGGGGGYFEDGSNRIGGAGGSGIVIITPPSKDFGFGADSSGNGNNFIEHNFNKSDQMLDTPTNNFCTLNPLAKKGTMTLSEGNLKAGGSSSTGIVGGSFAPVTSGKWYFEHQILNQHKTRVGFRLASTAQTEDNLGFAMNSQGDAFTSYDYNFGSGNGEGTATNGDIVGHALDLDNQSMKFYVNNSLVRTYTNFTAAIAAEGFVPFVFDFSDGGDNTLSVIFNFGQDSSFAGTKTAQGNQDGNSEGDFFYTPASGYLALCTKNLPDVAVVPSEYFNTALYSGTGSNQNITTGFQSNLTWIKNRGSDDPHTLFDSVRGVTKSLASNTTGAEITTANSLTAFNSNNFTVGSSNTVNNGNNNTYVSWNWKAGTSVSGNSTGSGADVAYAGSINTDAGFSIIKYGGNNTAGHQIPHHLGVVPDMIWIKNLTTQSWNCFFPNTSLGATKGLQLDNGGPQGTISHLNNTMPSTSVVTLGTGAGTNTKDGNDDPQPYMMYSFKSIEGYSKIGEYKGNGNANGTFVYTGFRPILVIAKVTGLDESWRMVDSKRGVYNVVDEILYPNTNGVEAHSDDIDLLSNGFKLRKDDYGWNTSGYTYVFYAVAETPFKYSNAR